MSGIRRGIQVWSNQTNARRWLACIATLALLAVAIGCASGKVETETAALAEKVTKVEAVAEKAVMEPAVAEKAVVEAAVAATLEVEDMELTHAVAVDDSDLKGAKAVRFEGMDSKAVGSVALKPGAYAAKLYMLRPDGDHDAVILTVGGTPATRVFRGSEELGPTEQTVPFKVEEAGDVPVEIAAAEYGMLLDRVEFVSVSE
ncbi:hypothetical protein JW916_08280 [Candidatus Sumerlaeota bacterium]|nr:hypothetical protein [Candidatus Sumerlaeota bacterium]